jgi:DNA-binding protein H-NS
MATLKELIEQKEALDAQIEAARNAELSGAIAQIRALMAEYQLTPADILGVSAKTPKTRNSPVAPKYRDPISGATWSGRGRSPAWLQGRNKEEFLIG